ncbi:hypothetical protein [Paenibacillus sp. sgz500958]|uniref:hypothetical protein n=1 Tax=Paenibacillus sp. sgz500958 TaxID=3242475 RepID=UPI0036D3E3FA
MKRTVKAIGITAALAVMIPFSAYAATTGSKATDTTTKSAIHNQSSVHEGRGGIGIGGGISQAVLDLLKLDNTAFQAKVDAGKTLAQIAEEQGVSRDSLKSALTSEFDKKQVDQKTAFTANLDSLIDGKLQGKAADDRGFGFRGTVDYTATATLLGLTTDELKTELSAGKSLADLAKSKGVDVQKLIDAQAAALTASIKQAVTDGKLTQAQADTQLANIAALAEKIVNRAGVEKGQHGGGKGRGFGGERPAATGSAQGTDATSAASGV